MKKKRKYKGGKSENGNIKVERYAWYMTIYGVADTKRRTENHWRPTIWLFAPQTLDIPFSCPSSTRLLYKCNGFLLRLLDSDHKKWPGIIYCTPLYLLPSSPSCYGPALLRVPLSLRPSFGLLFPLIISPFQQMWCLRALGN